MEQLKILLKALTENRGKLISDLPNCEITESLLLKAKIEGYNECIHEIIKLINT